MGGCRTVYSRQVLRDGEDYLLLQRLLGSGFSLERLALNHGGWGRTLRNGQVQVARASPWPLLHPPQLVPWLWTRPGASWALRGD
jgi:hypothetical protein